MSSAAKTYVTPEQYLEMERKVEKNPSMEGKRMTAIVAPRVGGA